MTPPGRAKGEHRGAQHAGRPIGRTVGEALAEARTLGVDRRDACWLLEDLLGRPRSWLVAHPDHPVDPERRAAWRGRVERLASGEPLGYLLGTQSFRGFELRVDRRVLVPRADTETLVDWALERLDAAPTETPRVVDLGTGSGAIALALARARPRADLLATDLSAEALHVAQANAERLELGGRVGWALGSWWSVAGGRRFDLAVSNPPYLAAGDPHLPALRHEPALALVSGSDGLDAIRDIVAGAREHLVPGGWLLVEHGFEQGAALRALLRDHGFDRVETRLDAGGRERCTGGACCSR